MFERQHHWGWQSSLSEVTEPLAMYVGAFHQRGTWLNEDDLSLALLSLKVRKQGFVSACTACLGIAQSLQAC
jgi:hypothetical protein